MALRSRDPKRLSTEYSAYFGFSWVGRACKWLRGVDLNHRPLGYEPNELPDCSTPRIDHNNRDMERQTKASGRARTMPFWLNSIERERHRPCAQAGCRLTSGDPGGSRTPNPQFRRLMLYPVELRGRDVSSRLSAKTEWCALRDSNSRPSGS
jgi:hypothetical protein